MQHLSPGASHPNPSQSVRLPMVTYCLLYSTYHQMLPTLTLPREDFPRGDRYFKHVPPLRYLIYLSVFYYLVVFIRLGISLKQGFNCLLQVLNLHSSKSHMLAVACLDDWAIEPCKCYYISKNNLIMVKSNTNKKRKNNQQP